MGETPKLPPWAQGPGAQALQEPCQARQAQNPPGATTPWGKHHRRESCQVHAHVCQKTCAYASLKALTLYSLYFLNNKNAIKIKEKLVSISGFLFKLKIQGVFLQKHY